MSERFTKGPWSIFKHDGRVGNVFTAICCTNNNTNVSTKIADLPDTYYMNSNNMAEVLANAALIAAAPEMYAMLEELYDNLNRGMKYIISRRVKNGCPIDLARKCSASNIELARRIKALLKKARGEK